MHVLYTPEEAAAIRRWARGLKVFMLALAAGALAACVSLCFFVTTANAGRLLAAAVIISTLAGWAVILLRAGWYAPAKAVYTHMEGVLAAQEREAFTGTLTPEAGTLRIPNSIWIRRVTLTDAQGGTVALSVPDGKAAQLPPAGTAVRVQTVRKYILAWEAAHEET